MTTGVWDFGADCDSVGNYQAIDLDQVGLDGRNLQEFFLLTRLSYISMSDNNLRSGIPTEIGTLAKLTNLDLHSNKGRLLGLLTALTYLGL